MRQGNRYSTPREISWGESGSSLPSDREEDDTGENFSRGSQGQYENVRDSEEQEILRGDSRIERRNESEGVPP